MNPWRWVDPRVASVRLEGVKGYLLARGWHVAPERNPGLLRFERHAGEGVKPLYQVVPASEQVDDFTQSITYLITTLSEIEDRHPVEIVDDIVRQQPGAGTAPVNGPSGERTARPARR